MAVRFDDHYVGTHWSCRYRWPDWREYCFGDANQAIVLLLVAAQVVVDHGATFHRLS